MRYEEERERYAFLISQLEEAQASSDLQALRYASGVAGYTDYLDALRTLLGVQSTLSEARTELGLARLAVHRGLGGGWTTEAPQPALGLVPTQALIEEIP
jgi:outer membrane protein TolC